MPTFGTLIEQSGTKIYIKLPFDPNEAWGDKARHHVRGTINGVAVRGPLTSDGEGYRLSMGPAWLRDSGFKVGDLVNVELSPEGPQLDSMPEDITAALQANEQARVFFESLATFYRKGYLRWIKGARQPEARRARIAEMIELLEAGKNQR